MIDGAIIKKSRALESKWPMGFALGLCILITQASHKFRKLSPLIASVSVIPMFAVNYL